MAVPMHQSILRLLSIALLGLMAGGCIAGDGGGKSNVPYAPANFGKPDEEAVAVSPASQRLGVGDTVTIAVFQVPDLSGDFRVDAAGNISMPLIGGVPAQGKTAEELASNLEGRLGATYLRDPNVRVAIKEQTAQTFTVDGSVNQPGVFAIKGPTTIMMAVATAGGVNQDGDPSRVVVFRQINGQRMAAAFNLAAIRRGNAEDPVIYGNDIIVVDGSRARAIYKELLTAFPVFAIFRPF